MPLTVDASRCETLPIPSLVPAKEQYGSAENLMAARLTIATLDRVAGRTAVPGPPIASAGALIGGTITAAVTVSARRLELT